MVLGSRSSTLLMKMNLIWFDWDVGLGSLVSSHVRRVQLESCSSMVFVLGMLLGGRELEVGVAVGSCINRLLMVKLGGPVATIVTNWGH